MGRMGREIALLALADPEIRIAGCIETASHPCAGMELGPLIGESNCKVKIETSLSRVPLDNAVLIDFTSPSTTLDVISQTAGKSTRIVIGTTGLSNEQTELVKNAAKTTAILMSPNMSLGVNILFYLTRVAAGLLKKDFDIEIIEAHHRMKKDAPSGTARMLGEIAAASRGLSYAESVRDGRSGITGERTGKEIGMHAVRGGDIVGDHTVLFAGPDERIELKHMAHSRRTLARGAVIAAKWISSKPAGFYNMGDVLGI
jgi:4-hydroxy-tetrahydrodipicolinate reductase